MARPTEQDVAAVMSGADGAYAQDRYAANWKATCRVALTYMGTVGGAVELLRSKHLRWADDSEGAGGNRQSNGATLRRYLIKNDAKRPTPIRDEMNGRLAGAV